MVCEMTLPPWVPVFSVAGAIVADVGGVLSHTAIVAREFGVPAVVGTEVGTTAIKTGQTITVDGTKGVVYLDGRSVTEAATATPPGSAQRAGLRGGLGPELPCWPGPRPSASARNLGHTTVGVDLGGIAGATRSRSRSRRSRSPARPARRTSRCSRRSARVLDVVGGVADEAGDEDLAVRQLHVLPDPPLVVVPGLATSKLCAPALIASMNGTTSMSGMSFIRGAVVQAVAGVVADLVGRDVPQGVVERLDVHPGHALALVRLHAGRSACR